jgi:hypothetical protein
MLTMSMIDRICSSQLNAMRTNLHRLPFLVIITFVRRSRNCAKMSSFSVGSPARVLHNFKCLRTLVSLQVGENLSAKPSAPLGKRTRGAISRGCASWVSPAAQIARGITKLIAEMED